MNTTHAIDGIFIPFSGSESAAMYTNLQSMDYSPDTKGLKQFLTDHLIEINSEEENRREPSTISDTILTFLRENPEIASRYGKMGKSIIKSFFDEKKRAGK